MVDVAAFRPGWENWPLLADARQAGAFTTGRTPVDAWRAPAQRRRCGCTVLISAFAAAKRKASVELPRANLNKSRFARELTSVFRDTVPIRLTQTPTTCRVRSSRSRELSDPSFRRGSCFARSTASCRRISKKWPTSRTSPNFPSCRCCGCH